MPDDTFGSFRIFRTAVGRGGTQRGGCDRQDERIALILRAAGYRTGMEKAPSRIRDIKDDRFSPDDGRMSSPPEKYYIIIIHYFSLLGE
jgi:hypothetical protein